ncbi:MAG: glycosyltransferase family 4 protein [Candidatus Micrarchaeota archaeon]
MRLVITTPFLETRGGMERVILQIAQRFDARIHCLSYDADDTFPEFSKLDVEVARPTFLRSLPFGKRVSTAIEAGYHFYNTELEDYDVINAHQTPSEWIRNRNSPVIWYSHTPNREAFDLYEWRMKRRSLPSKAVFWSSIQAFKFFEYRTVPKLEHIFTNSLNSQARIKKYLHRESEVLHPGVDSDRFSCKAYEDFFFYPSRIAPEKEIEYAIEAFKIFRNRVDNVKHGTGNWKLVIAGALSKRPEHIAYFDRLKSMCDDSIAIETNVGDWQLRDLYARCHAVLYTPVNEDYGLVPLEAMASSKPCIARNEGGPKETIIDGSDGFLINSIWEMAGRMEKLAKDQELCASMGKIGRRKVKRDFTWEAFLKRFSEKAEELMCASPR